MSSLASAIEHRSTPLVDGYIQSRLMTHEQVVHCSWVRVVDGFGWLVQVQRSENDQSCWPPRPMPMYPCEGCCSVHVRRSIQRPTLMATTITTYVHFTIMVVCSLRLWQQRLITPTPLAHGGCGWSPLAVACCNLQGTPAADGRPSPMILHRKNPLPSYRNSGRWLVVGCCWF